MADIVYQYKNQVYLNITNRCPCRCEFCIRSHGDSVGDAENLWFEREPELEEIFDAVDSFDFSGCREIIYCGYGEPVMALDKIKQISPFLRERFPDCRIRLNTNGLGDLIYGRSTAGEVCRLADSISISLNMPDADSYEAVVHPVYGKKAFASMLQFAQDCKAILGDVRFTVVDIIGREKVEESRRLAQRLGIPLRVREYSE